MEQQIPDAAFQMTTDAIQQRERELFEAYVTARRKKDKLSQEKSAAEIELADATNKIVTYLIENKKKSTGKYDDIGQLTVLEPTPRAKYDKENEPQVFEWVRAAGGEAIIKPTIHPATFASFIREKISAGESLPDFMEIYSQPSVRYLQP